MILTINTTVVYHTRTTGTTPLYCTTVYYYCCSITTTVHPSDENTHVQRVHKFILCHQHTVRSPCTLRYMPSCVPDLSPDGSW